ncbi:hypothetical protein ACQ4WP_00670 [Janthinobacterium sp. GB4P2]|uniref:hypothetical protein n=1 Tax=Janthinobacterium sp. GB4P2 TaxID=3424189 RepID=UPI003F22EECE
MPRTSTTLASSAIGAMFFSLFGGVWVAAWCEQTFGAQPLALLPIAGLTVLLFMLAWSQFRRHRAAHAAAEQSPQAKRVGRLFNIVNAGQWIAIFIVGNVLKNVGLQAWFIPAVILIVGLHFFPLAWLFKARRHLAIGVALCVWAIGYPLTVRHGPIHPVGCLGAGLILWVAARSAVRAGFAVQQSALQPQK